MEGSITQTNIEGSLDRPAAFRSNHNLRHHQGMVSPNGLAQEGYFRVPKARGLGVELAPSVLARLNVLIQSIGR